MVTLRKPTEASDATLIFTANSVELTKDRELSVIPSPVKEIVAPLSRFVPLIARAWPAVPRGILKGATLVIVGLSRLIEIATARAVARTQPERHDCDTLQSVACRFRYTQRLTTLGGIEVVG